MNKNIEKKEWRLLALKYEKRKNEDEDPDSSFASYINWKSEKWKYIGEVKKKDRKRQRFEGYTNI